MTSTCRLELLLVGAALCLSGGAAHAQSSAAFTFREPPSGSPSLAGTDGFEFRPRVDIVVTSLGYYDQGRDGLSLRHTIALYDTVSRLKLAWVTLDRRGTLAGMFRYRAIKPRRLQAGRSYIVAGFHSGSGQDFAASDPAPLKAAPAIGYQSYRADYGARLRFPGIVSEGAFFGPNFRFRIAS